MIPINRTVELNSDSMKRGVVAGYATYFRDGEPMVMYLVDLAEGFYSPDRRTYIGTIVAHPDNVKIVEHG